VSSEHCKQEVYSVKVVVLPEFFLGTSTLRPLVRAKYPTMVKDDMGGKGNKGGFKSDRLRTLYGGLRRSERQKRMNKIGHLSKIEWANTRFGNGRDCQGVVKTKGLGAKMYRKQKKRHKLGNGTNMCKRIGGICLIVEVYKSE